MVEKIKGVRNPLTVIAFFATVAETSGAAILPLLSDINQQTYIWFLMFFPTFLVALFFLTLNFNPKVLYSPSDFRDEENYIKIFQPSTTAEILKKLHGEVSEGTQAGGDAPVNVPSGARAKTKAPKLDVKELIKNDPTTRYGLIVSLAIEHFWKALDVEVSRNRKILNDHGAEYVFDGVIPRKGGFTVIEVKVLTRKNMPMMALAVGQLGGFLESLPPETRNAARLILVFVYEMPETEAPAEVKKIMELVSAFDIRVQLKTISMQKLLEELETK